MQNACCLNNISLANDSTCHGEDLHMNHLRSFPPFPETVLFCKHVKHDLNFWPTGFPSKVLSWHAISSPKVLEEIGSETSVPSRHIWAQGEPWVTFSPKTLVPIKMIETNELRDNMIIVMIWYVPNMERIAEPLESLSQPRPRSISKSCEKATPNQILEVKIYIRCKIRWRVSSWPQSWRTGVRKQYVNIKATGVFGGYAIHIRKQKERLRGCVPKAFLGREKVGKGSKRRFKVVCWYSWGCARIQWALLQGLHFYSRLHHSYTSNKSQQSGLSLQTRASGWQRRWFIDSTVGCW